MQRLRCHNCGKLLPTGTIKYVVEIRSFADFDGYLEEYSGNIEEGINELLAAMDEMDEKTLQEDVSTEQIAILCKGCRDRLIQDPFQSGKAILDTEEAKGTVH